MEAGSCFAVVAFVIAFDVVSFVVATTEFVSGFVVEVAVGLGVVAVNEFIKVYW